MILLLPLLLPVRKNLEWRRKSLFIRLQRLFLQVTLMFPTLGTPVILTDAARISMPVAKLC